MLEASSTPPFGVTAVSIAATVAVMGWLARARDAGSAGPAGILRPPKALLYLGILFTLPFLALTLAAIFARKPDESPWLVLFVLPFDTLGPGLIMEYRNSWHRLTKSGLEYGRFFGQRGLLPWQAVAGVSYSQAWKWFVLRRKDGRVVRVSAMCSGLPAFATAVLAQVPPQAIDPKTLPILQQTAAGNPPSIIG